MEPDKKYISKGGPWSRKEKKYIAEYCDIMPYDEMARKLGRNPKRIKEYISNRLGKKAIPSKTLMVEVSNAEYTLKHSPVWHELERQFAPEELDMFMWHWKRMYAQFKEDVLATEETQMIDAIKLEVLMNRLLINQRENELEIKTIESELQREKKLPVEMQDINRVEGLVQQITFRRAAQENISKEFRDLFEKKSKQLEKLKATREMRIKHLEGSKESMLGWMRKIFTDGEMRQKLGIEMEKMRMGQDHAYKSLSQYHLYADGTADIPILNVETVRQNKDKQNTTDSDI